MLGLVRALTLASLLGALGFVLVPANADHGYAAPYTVTAALTKSRVDLGGGATLSGSVSPTAAGHSVAIKVLQPGESTWSTLKTVILDPQSRYSTVVRPTRAGVTSYRAVRATVGGHHGASSPARTLTAWRWRSLGGIPAASGPASGAFTKSSGMFLNGQLFKPVFVQTPGDGTAFGDKFFDLGGRCTRLDAWVSATYDSVDDDEMAAWILGDTVADPGSFTNQVARNIVHRLGDPAHISRYYQLSDVDTLDLYIDSVAPGDKVVWGRPMVYCKF
ncbi:MAG: hypothetical protein ACJ72D_12520 [Marmoricola sp.]